MRKNQRKWPKILVMVLAVTVLTGSVALVLVEKFAPNQTYIPQSLVSLPSRVVSALVKPFQSAFAWASQGVSGYLESWKLRKNIEIEYNSLLAQNEDLIYRSLQMEDLEIRYEELVNLLTEKKNNAEYTPIMATVTGKETGNWFRMFTIDVGENDGIKENMAVINSDGLIGYTYAVHDTTSEVISIIDSRAGIGAIIQSSRDQGVIRGTLGLDDEASCRMYNLPTDTVPRPDDVVVTNGIGLPFPKGIKIGVVRESTRNVEEGKHYYTIDPYVDFLHIEHVLVLVYDAPKEDASDTGDGQLSYEMQPLDTARPTPLIGGEVLTDENLGAVTAPPRVTRSPSEEAETGTGAGGDGPGSADASPLPYTTLAPGATPTSNPELDRLLDEELSWLEDF